MLNLLVFPVVFFFFFWLINFHLLSSTPLCPCSNCDVASTITGVMLAGINGKALEQRRPIIFLTFHCPLTDRWPRQGACLPSSHGHVMSTTHTLPGLYRNSCNRCTVESSEGVEEEGGWERGENKAQTERDRRWGWG